MDIAISPCPNDTYIFHAWISKLVGEDIPLHPHFADIEQLNEWAFSKKYPVIKISFGCFRNLIDSYQLLPCGSALGFNCGPKLIAKKPFRLGQLQDKKVAIPGRHTTAHILLDRFIGNVGEKVYCRYHEIYDLLDRNKVDAGLIIHESRFTFSDRGFFELADLGEIWQNTFSLPLPLGGIAVKRSLVEAEKKRITSILKSSLKFAKENPEKSVPFISEKSQEKNRRVIDAHIHTYVTSETEYLSSRGISAIETMLDRRASDWLFSENEE